MSVATETKRYTPEDLLDMPDGERFELVDGRLVERNIGTWSSYVAGELHARLREYGRTTQHGWAFPEGTSYHCFSDAPAKVRRPDVSYVRASKLSSKQAQREGHLHVVPDLAVEVVSPNDRTYESDQKIDEYLRAGVMLVWLVNPQAQTIQVHRPGENGIILRQDDDLDGGDVLPGFRCRIRELFDPPPGSESPEETNGAG